MKKIYIIGFLMLLAVSVSAQRTTSERDILNDQGAVELFKNYKRFYNEQLYIHEGHANYHITNQLFTGDFMIRNDFAGGRPYKLSVKDYIKYLADHFSFGVQVKTSKLKLINRTDEKDNTLITIAYTKELFGQFDEGAILSRSFTERLTLSKNAQGIWKISGVELLTPPLLSVDLSAGVHAPGFAITGSGTNTGIAGFRQDDQLSFSYGIDLEVNLNKNVSIATGFHIMKYATTLYADQVEQEEVLSIDKDGETYFLRAGANDIEDNIDLQYFKIPMLLKYYIMPENAVVPFVGAGLNMHLLSMAESNMTGVSTQTGYYPQYHVLLYDIPELGFITDNSYSRDESLKPENTYFSVQITAGARVQLFKDRVYGMFSLFYDAALSPFVSSEDYILSANAQEYNSLIYSGSEVRLNTIGAKIGLKFKIK